MEAPNKAKKTPAKMALESKNTAVTKKKVVRENVDKKFKKEANVDSTEEGNGRVPKTKKKSKLERLEEARQAFKWWEAPELPNGANWLKLEHCGVNFAPPYERHDVPIHYDGRAIQLTDEQEELASFYAAMPEDGPQLGGASRDTFQKRFFTDFKETFPVGHHVKEFNKCNFSAIRDHLTLQQSLKKAATDDEKGVIKADKDALVLKFGYALIDGRMEKMGNYNMEPPGLFRGRGEHPKTGMVKQRCFAESVAINVGEDACPPVCAMPGHAWGSVRHDPQVPAPV